ncbi:MAG TPA: FAD-dependent monooxygenase [Macromonas sp.]|nr:FAD-dependent monooxygenase [Macromonas sp.]
MNPTVVVAGAGIAGLGAALACARAVPGLQVQLLEQADAFGEVGAGLQLGPNAVRVLDDWGLTPALQAVAAFPDELWVREALSGRVLSGMALGARAKARYGQPYATLHRADLHALLLQAVQAQGQTECHLRQRVHRLVQEQDRVLVQAEGGWSGEAGLLLGCDGGRSRVRELCLGDGTLAFSGDLAYRGLIAMEDLPPRLRQNRVTAWLAPGFHAVQYPVRGGALMNVVVVIEGPLPPPGAAEWDHVAHATDLRLAVGDAHDDLDLLLDAVPSWRLWPLNVRPPMRGAHEHGRGRVALLGDAAHPTRPYLAQGAAMALEDAWTLGRLLDRRLGAPGVEGWGRQRQRWADWRWRRNAWVQARSRRNGTVFHLGGPLRWGRDLALRLAGEALLDQPFLYDGPPVPPLSHEAA